MPELLRAPSLAACRQFSPPASSPALPLQAALPEAGTPAAPPDENTQAAEAAAINQGARCEVEGGRRGVVRYVGRVEGLPLGYWVGVQVSIVGEQTQLAGWAGGQGC